MPEVATCEICGRPVKRIRYYIVHGAKLILCDICAKKLGAKVAPPEEKTANIRKKTPPSRISRRSSLKKQRKIEIPEELQYEFIPNFHKKIIEARLKRNISTDQLARILNIPRTYLHKIEREVLKPDIGLAQKIEKILKIKILRKVDYELLESLSTLEDKVEPITLGDIIVIERKKKKNVDEGD